MKKLFILAVAISIGTIGFSQKGKNKSSVPETTKEEARRVILGEEKTKTQPTDKAEKQNNSKHDNAVVDGKKGGGPKYSKNQPTKARQAFATDYPGATNVRWSKYRGDWTATFSNNGVTSTAVYHANGQRKDTRTAVDRQQLPVKIEEIFRKKPLTKLGDITRIDLPGVRKLFRVKTVEAGTSNYTIYDTNGSVVHYDY
jgi:hypothetical protein